MQGLSLDASSFRPRGRVGRFDGSGGSDNPQNSPYGGSFYDSLFPDGYPLGMDMDGEGPESEYLQFSGYNAVRNNYMQLKEPTLSYHSDSASFPSFHRRHQIYRKGVKRHGPHQSSIKVFNPNYPSYVPAKAHIPFLVHVDEIPQSSTCDMKAPVPDLIFENEISTADMLSGHKKRSFHGGKENEHRLRPAIRRKPVPKVVLDDKIRTSSFMRFSTLDSFPALRTRESGDSKLPEDTSRSFGRTDVIGKYSLTQFLSQGAQGKVYLAKSNASNKMSAIKVISKLTLENYQTLLQEKKLLQRIKGHPFVLNLIDSFHDTENFYLVTDYYAGGDLAHLLYNLKTFDIDLARFYISELIVAIKFLHSNEIIHRDLKPSNILIKADGHICIVDFGLCKDFLSKKSANHDRCIRARNLKVANRIIGGPLTDGFAGTLVYMSPQVISQELYSYETDWWSMGIILYELLQGDTPWTGSDVTCMMRKIKKEPLLFRSDVDPAASDLLYKLLEKRVEDRIHVSEFPSHEFFAPIDFNKIEAGLSPPPYIPLPEDGGLPLGVLKDKEKIYVGRAYATAGDPFPEYNYDNLPRENNMDIKDYCFASDSSSMLSTTDVDFIEAPSTPRTSGRGVGDSIMISPLNLNHGFSPVTRRSDEAYVDSRVTLSPKDVQFHTTPRRSPVMAMFSSSRITLSSKFKRMYPRGFPYDASPLSSCEEMSFMESPSPNTAGGANQHKRLSSFIFSSPSPLGKHHQRRGSIMSSADAVKALQLVPSPVIGTPTKKGLWAQSQEPSSKLLTHTSPQCLTPPTPSFHTAISSRQSIGISGNSSGGASSASGMDSVGGTFDSLFSVNVQGSQFTEGTLPSISDRFPSIVKGSLLEGGGGNGVPNSLGVGDRDFSEQESGKLIVTEGISQPLGQQQANAVQDIDAPPLATIQWIKMVILCIFDAIKQVLSDLRKGASTS